MGVQNPNSTNYVHPNEPNLLNVHKALTYDPVNGEPHLRVTLGSDNITVSGNVNLVEAVRVNNTEAQMIPVYLVGNVLTVNQGTSPWVTTGNANVTGNVSITQMPGITGNVGVVGNVNVTQGTSPWTVSALNTTTNSGSFEWQVARGAVTGAVAVNVFGHQDLISITPWAVWDRAADYVFPTTASQLTVVSTSATDNNTCRVTIFGLDADWNPLVEQVALTGTNTVTTAGTFLRINQMLMTAPATGQINNVGTITAKIGDTIYAQINPGIGKTKMAVYSVAAGKSFYLTQITALAGSATGTSKYMNFQAVIKNNLTGVSFTLLQATWQNVYQVQRVVPLAYGEKQDIKWQLYTNSGDYPASIIVEGALLTN
jgi:hypothetical protein